MNTRCATAVRIFFDHKGYVAHLAREVGPASPEAGFRANCRRPLLTTAAQADNLLVLPLLPFTQEPSGWTGVGFFLLKNIFFEILRLIIFVARPPGMFLRIIFGNLRAFSSLVKQT